MPNPLKSLVKNIDQHLKRLQWTRKTLAEKASVTPSNLTQYLQESHTPSLEVIERIASAIGVQSWELIKPIDSTATQIPPSPTLEALSKIISDQEKKIKELKSQIAVPQLEKRQEQLKFFIDFLNSADDVELNETIKRIESVRKLTRDKKLNRSEKSKGRSGSTP